MDRTVRLLFCMIIAIAITACDDVVLPSTDREPGVNDLVDNGLGDTLVIHGSIVKDLVGQNRVKFGAPSNTFVIVGWFNGRDHVAFGRGAINNDRTRYSLTMDSPLPEDLLFAVDPSSVGQSTHGLGTVFLSTVDHPDGTIVGPRTTLGTVVSAHVIYNTGRDDVTPLSSPWIDDFLPGYSMGSSAFAGYIPNPAPEYALIYR